MISPRLPTLYVVLLSRYLLAATRGRGRYVRTPGLRQCFRLLRGRVPSICPPVVHAAGAPDPWLTTQPMPRPMDPSPHYRMRYNRAEFNGESRRTEPDETKAAKQWADSVIRRRFHGRWKRGHGRRRRRLAIITPAESIIFEGGA